MLIVFFDCVSIIHHKFLPCGQTVNMEYYLTVMKRQKEAVTRKKVRYVEGKKWLLHYNNATVHSSLLILIFSQNMR